MALVALLAGLLGVDLVLHRSARAPSLRRAGVESALWVACGLGFALLVWVAFGPGAFGGITSDVGIRSPPKYRRSRRRAFRHRSSTRVRST